MFARSKAALAVAMVSLGLVCIALAQSPGPAGPPASPSVSPSAAIVSAASYPAGSPPPAVEPSRQVWRAPAGTDGPAPAGPSAGVTTRTLTSGNVGPADAAGLQPLSGTPRTPIAKVTNGNGTLPNDHGQVWREYDISPYTLRVTSTNRPEQAIVDWILRETGYEAWHSEPLGILSADHRTLRVYHTPQMQQTVGELVDRFVNSEAQTQAFGLRVISMGNPSWRAKAQRILHPVAVQSQGIQAWTLAKEDASLMIADMRKRSDFREYGSPQMLVNNGQSTVVSTVHPKNYANAIILHPEQAHPGFEPQQGQFLDGFSLEFSPLLTLDGKAIDAMIKCNVDQLEKLVPVTIDVPTVVAPRQHAEIEVPQWASYRLHERFHWPTDQVLLISFGVISTPVTLEPAIKMPLVSSNPPRAELLLFLDNRGVGGQPPVVPPAATGQRENPLYRGRY